MKGILLFQEVLQLKVIDMVNVIVYVFLAGEFMV